jgi:hypothetical protein
LVLGRLALTSAPEGAKIAEDSGKSPETTWQTELEKLEKLWENLPAHERWEAEVSFFTKLYQGATSNAKLKLQNYRMRVDKVEAANSTVIESLSPQELRKLYEELLRIPPVVSRAVYEEMLRPRKRYRKLKFQFEQMSSLGKLATDESMSGQVELSRLKQVAMDFEEQMDELYQANRYLESFSNMTMMRMKDIRETEQEKQLTSLNENLRKMTKWILIASAVIAFFTVFTFIVTVFHL